MKITHNKIGQNLSLKDTQKGAGALNTEKAKDGLKDPKLDSGGPLAPASLNISQRAAEMQKAKALVSQIPDVDEAKVARFQKLIDSGEYKVDSAKVAEKMLDEQMSWE